MDRKDVLMDEDHIDDHVLNDPISKPSFLLSGSDPLESNFKKIKNWLMIVQAHWMKV